MYKSEEEGERIEAGNEDSETHGELNTCESVTKDDEQLHGKTT